MTEFNPQFVDNDTQLATLCTSWLEQPAIAIDTEFMRSETFYPHIGLLQIADNDGVYLIDPLKINDRSPLVEVLRQTSVVKIIHSCSQDLAVFHHYFGILPETIFDTQIAAGFIGHGMAISYAKLLKTLLGIDIPKQETRSNWLRRPLSDAQLHYAAMDVAYLLPIYLQMKTKLEQQQRLAWVESDCQQLLDKTRESLEHSHYYTRIKSAWKLDYEELAILKTLCNWREQQAHRQDVPRNRIAKDALLWELAVKKPQTDAEIQNISKYCPQTVSMYGDALMTLIKNVLQDDDHNYPELIPRPLSREQGQLIKQLKAKVKEIASDNQLPPELLMCKKDYELLLRSGEENADYQLPDSLKNWRQSLLEQPLITLLADVIRPAR